MVTKLSFQGDKLILIATIREYRKKAMILIEVQDTETHKVLV